MGSAPDHQRRWISVGVRAPTTAARIGGSGFAAAVEVAVPFLPDAKRWFARHTPAARLQSVGFRLTPGGTHLARTLMLAELGQVLAAASDPSPDEVSALVVDQNILQKRTGSGRRLSLRHLRGLRHRAWRATTDPASDDRPVGAPAKGGRCWRSLRRWRARRCCATAPRSSWRRLLARRCVHPNWRHSSNAAIPAATRPKCCVPCREIARRRGHNPGISRGRRAKSGRALRSRRRPRRYAALLGSLAGFGGPALLASPWLAVLDRSDGEALTLLRKAEADGLLRLRAGWRQSSRSKSGATWPRRWGYPNLPTTDELLRHFEHQVALPWRDDLAPEYRIWILHYEPALERRSAAAWGSSSWSPVGTGKGAARSRPREPGRPLVRLPSALRRAGGTTGRAAGPAPGVCRACWKNRTRQTFLRARTR